MGEDLPRAVTLDEEEEKEIVQAIVLTAPEPRSGAGLPQASFAPSPVTSQRSSSCKCFATQYTSYRVWGPVYS